MMETLTIKITRIPRRCHIIDVGIPPKSFWGTDFFKNERHFISKVGFVISSANYICQASVRTAHFTFPDKPMKTKTKIGDSPKDRWYLEWLSKTVDEFNNTQKEKRIDLINK